MSVKVVTIWDTGSKERHDDDDEYVVSKGSNIGKVVTPAITAAKEVLEEYERKPASLSMSTEDVARSNLSPSVCAKPSQKTFFENTLCR